MAPGPDYTRAEHFREIVLQSDPKFLLTKEGGLDTGQVESSAVSGNVTPEDDVSAPGTATRHRIPWGKHWISNEM